MLKWVCCVLAAVATLGFTVAPTTAEAGWGKSKYKSKYSSKYRSRHARKSYGRRSYKKRRRVRSRRRSQVRGFFLRGGYSYRANDVANTYGDSRTRFGSVNSYRDPFVDRQTVAGPFDHGWFFDSAVAPRGGDSPYMQ